MNNYELTIVLDGKSGSAKAKKVTESLEKFLAISKGIIKETKDWGVKDLAYKIGKSTKGQYLYFEIEMDPKSAKALNEKLRTDGDVIRYLLIKFQKPRTKSQTSPKS